MTWLLHKIAHLLHINGGHPESHYDGAKLIMCFKCAGCGDLSQCHEVNWIDKELSGGDDTKGER